MYCSFSTAVGADVDAVGRDSAANGDAKGAVECIAVLVIVGSAGAPGALERPLNTDPAVSVV